MKFAVIAREEGDRIVFDMDGIDGELDRMAVVHHPGDVLPCAMQCSALIAALIVQMYYEVKAA